MPPRHRRHRAFASLVVVSLLPTAALVIAGEGTAVDDDVDGEIDRDGGDRLPAQWEDGPSSWDEFGHDNDPSVCGLRMLTVKEWEAGRYWEGREPVLVSGVTDGWPALNNWKKRVLSSNFITRTKRTSILTHESDYLPPTSFRRQEMLRLYPNAEARMGEAKLVRETGPDNAGKNLSPTTVKVR